MDAETWLSARKAVELGFADGILEDEKRANTPETYAFSRRAVTNSLLDKIRPVRKSDGILVDSLEKRLNLIPH